MSVWEFRTYVSDNERIAMDYKKMIIEMVEKIESEDFLKKIFWYAETKYEIEQERKEAGN